MLFWTTVLQRTLITIIIIIIIIIIISSLDCNRNPLYEVGVRQGVSRYISEASAEILEER